MDHVEIYLTNQRCVIGLILAGSPVVIPRSIIIAPGGNEVRRSGDDPEGEMVQQALKRRLVNQFHCQANGFEPTNPLRGDGKAYHFTRVINREGGKYVSFSDRLATPPSRINRLT